MDKSERQVRSLLTKFETREEENGDPVIEGYFSVFDSDYQLWEGVSESVAPGAFSETLGNDIRALIDHDPRLVLGRCKSGTLKLREDSKGLWGKIKINRNDTDAMNLYARIKRGDVDQCSFGFNILDQDLTQRDGGVHWTIRKVDLHEVSVVTFPAYEETTVTARKQDYEEIQKRKTEIWKNDIRKKLKGEKQNGAKGINA